MSPIKNNSAIGYREAKRIIENQEEARDIINQYRGIETLGDRLGMNSNPDLILTLFEIEEDESVTDVMTHLRALYPEQWNRAENAPAPDKPGAMAVQQNKQPATTAPVEEPAPVEELEPVG